MAPSIAAASPLHSRTSLTQQHTSGLNFMPHSTRLTRSRAPEPDPFAEEPPTTPTSHGNAHIDIPTGTQSSVTMSVSNDGKVMKLVARFESYDSSEGSDVSQVHGQDIYVHTTTASAGEASHEHKAEADSPTGSGQADPLEEELDPCSPRKPLPAQWGPVLRTQMRSEERERRKAANSSSPSNPPSPRKLQRAEPKASPKSATIAARLSPNKSNVAESRHSRATSSVSGESVYFTANNSPVSSSDGDSASDVSCSPSSFNTAIEHHDSNVEPLDLAHADDEGQSVTGKAKSHSNLRADAALSMTNLSKKEIAARIAVPKLFVKIPTSTNTQRQTMSLAPAMATTTPAPPPSRASRIPRKAATKSPTKGTFLRRTKSGPMKEYGGISHIEPHDVPLPETPVPTKASAVRHVKTVNSVGATPIISRGSSARDGALSDKESVAMDVVSSVTRDDADTPVTPDQSASVKDETRLSDVKGGSLNARLASILKASPKTNSRASSASTVKPTSVDDPALVDSAIIYSRKKRASVSHSTSEAGPQVKPSTTADVAWECSEGSSRASALRATATPFIPIPEPAVFPLYGETVFTPNSVGVDLYGMPFFYPTYAPLVSTPCASPPRRAKTLSELRQGFPDLAGEDESHVESHFQSIGFDAQTSVRGAIHAAGGDNDNTAIDDDLKAFSAQLAEIEHYARQGLGEVQTSPSLPAITTHSTLPARGNGGRAFRHHIPGNGLYDTYRRARGAAIGVPMEDTTPFPDPVPPSGRSGHEYVGFSTGPDVVDKKGSKKSKKTNKHPFYQPKLKVCGMMEIEQAQEYGGGICNECDPDY